MNRRQDWTIRLIQESKSYDRSLFVTLTYNEENIVYGANTFGTVNKEDVQKFLKKFRKAFEPRKVRYYSVVS